MEGCEGRAGDCWADLVSLGCLVGEDGRVVNLWGVRVLQDPVHETDRAGVVYAYRKRRRYVLSKTFIPRLPSYC